GGPASLLARRSMTQGRCRATAGRPPSLRWPTPAAPREPPGRPRGTMPAPGRPRIRGTCGWRAGGSPGGASGLVLRGHPASGGGADQRLVVAFVLVRIHGGELGDGTVEDIGAAQVGGDGDAVPRTCVSPRQGCPADLAIDPHALGHHGRHVEG